MVVNMRENDRAAPAVELEFRKTPSVNRTTYIMKPSLVKEKPPEWRFYNYSSNCIALDRLVEVALSPTGLLRDSSLRNNANTPETQLVPSKFYSKSAGSRAGSRDGEGGEDGGDSAEKRRYCCSSNGIKVAKPAAPSSSSSPLPSSEAPNHHQSAGYFQQQHQQHQQQQKLKRRLSSFNEISTPVGHSSSSVHVQHAHAKRCRLAPRFKALVDISC